MSGALDSEHGIDARRLRHVRFIGGGSGAGKSTVARRLAGEYGFRLVETEPFSQYVPRTTPENAPLLHRFIAMNMDERWVTRSPEVMRDTFHGFDGETFSLLVEDLLALPDTPPILVEGFDLLPRLVRPLLSDPSQAVWLIPTPEFRRAAFDSRGSTYEIPRRTSHPERALRNLLARDHLFTEDLAEEAASCGLNVIRVDVATTVNDLVRKASEILALA